MARIMPSLAYSLTEVERFWSKVNTSDPGGCMPWLGPCRPYGKIRLGSLSLGTRREELAHRFALSIKLGRPIAPGKWALHHCDNPPCCNPEHLYEGDPGDNVRDTVERNPERFKGSGNPMAKLTEGDVIEIRSLAGREMWTYVELASRYGVSAGQVSGIARGLYWRD